MKTMKMMMGMGVALIAPMMMSCSNDDETANNEAGKEIRVEAVINNGTRTVCNDDVTTAFVDGDEIGVMVYTGADAAEAAACTNTWINATCTYVVGTTAAAATWVPGKQMLWKNSTDYHFFEAVYPKNLKDYNSDQNTLRLTGEEKNDDLLMAVSSTAMQSTGANPVLLTFNHLMGKLRVNLKFRDQWQDQYQDGVPPVAKVETRSSEMVYFDPVAKTVKPALSVAGTSSSGSSPTTSIIYPALRTMNEANVTPAGFALSYTLVLAPDKLGEVVVSIPKDAASSDLLTFTIDPATVDPAKAVIEAGKTTVLNLTIGRDAIVLDNSTIVPWQDGNTISGDAFGD
ncbi:MAG: fimbrillin family protein [Prevotella sp.]|nr:fimbrillin family protein [Prevotella sp.]